MEVKTKKFIARELIIAGWFVFALIYVFMSGVRWLPSAISYDNFFHGSGYGRDVVYNSSIGIILGLYLLVSLLRATFWGIRELGK